MDLQKSGLGWGGYSVDYGNPPHDNANGLQSSSTASLQFTLGKTAIMSPWLGAGAGLEFNSSNNLILSIFGFAAGQGVNSNFNLSNMGAKVYSLFGGETTSGGGIYVQVIKPAASRGGS